MNLRKVVKFAILIFISMIGLALSNDETSKPTWLSGKVVLITGASSGIGEATALYFAELGAKLALTGRNEDNLKRVVQKCEEISGQKPFWVIGDLNNEKDVEHVFYSTMKHYDDVLDVLINNAGMGWFGTLESSSLEQFDRTFNLNVRAVFQLTKLARPYLVQSKGNIVNVSSVTGLRAFKNILTYCMSKAALDQFTMASALEFAPDVRVNSVNPGVIVTEIQKRGGMSQSDYEAYLERGKETHALGRVGQGFEVARAIAFLASEDTSSFITGALLPIDGGRHVMCVR